MGRGWSNSGLLGSEALDVAYLRQWGGALRVGDLVARALAAAEG